ncbi:MAG: MBL fold metallo-hydrolase [Candidatus Aenigmatarchaeota archaeon]
MIIRCLGGCGEVGRSAYMVSENNSNVLLDYGVKLQPTLQLPAVPNYNLDGVFVSHPHLDHSGMVPLLCRLQRPRIFATAATGDLMNLLQEDYIKVGKLNRGFSEYTDRDMAIMNKSFRKCTYRAKFRIGNLEARVFPAYHVPGSASIHLRGRQSLLYTGDINLTKTYLLDYKKVRYPKTDVLMMESTYSERDHPDRKAEEMRLIDKVREYESGLVLVPSFAVGRAQELLLMLKANGIKREIYLDGMAQKAADIILFHKEELRCAKVLRDVMREVKFVRTKRQRDKICREGGIVVTTSGMLSGGPICYYLRKSRQNPNACLLLTGYQAEGTPGYNLLRTGHFESEEDGRYKVDIEVSKFDFSGHAGKGELLELIKSVNPKKVVCVHGENTESFAREIEKDFGIEAFAPKNGDELEV